jgi:hypothetical protein
LIGDDIDDVPLLNNMHNWSNTADATSGAGTAYPPGAPEFILPFLVGLTEKMDKFPRKCLLISLKITTKG